MSRLDTSAILGSGRGGRVTKDDIVNHLQNPPVHSAAPEPKGTSGSSREPRREKMTRLRQRIAERLVGAAQRSDAYDVQ